MYVVKIGRPTAFNTDCPWIPTHHNNCDTTMNTKIPGNVFNANTSGEKIVINNSGILNPKMQLKNQRTVNTTRTGKSFQDAKAPGDYPDCLYCSRWIQ